MCAPEAAERHCVKVQNDERKHAQFDGLLQRQTLWERGGAAHGGCELRAVGGLSLGSRTDGRRWQRRWRSRPRGAALESARVPLYAVAEMKWWEETAARCDEAKIIVRGEGKGNYLL